MFIWAGPDTFAGSPTKHTLERVVCGAICAAYPDRAKNVEEWLAADFSGKGAMWSHMAKWYPESGCSDFLRRAIWHDEKIAGHLINILVESGAIEAIESLESKNTIVW